MKIRHKDLPRREVCFSRPKLCGLKVRCTMMYSVESKGTRTYYSQPIEFELCDARHLAMCFHDIAISLTGQLREFKRDLRGPE